jgi:hypothetical protein
VLTAIVDIRARAEFWRGLQLVDAIRRALTGTLGLQHHMRRRIVGSMIATAMAANLFGRCNATSRQ